MVASYQSLSSFCEPEGEDRYRTDKGSGPHDRDSLTYNTQRGLAAVTEALEHRIAHETNQHVAFVSFRSRGVGLTSFASESRGMMRMTDRAH